MPAPSGYNKFQFRETRPLLCVQVSLYGHCVCWCRYSALASVSLGSLISLLVRSIQGRKDKKWEGQGGGERGKRRNEGSGAAEMCVSELVIPNMNKLVVRFDRWSCWSVSTLPPNHQVSVVALSPSTLPPNHQVSVERGVKFDRWCKDTED